MNKEQLVEKVKKLLALAGNNPNENEAQAAMLKAQKMIAEYNLEITDGEAKDEITTMAATHANNEGYRTRLGAILARNFRCEVFMHRNTVHFMGYEADVRVCTEIFNYAYKVSHNKGLRIERQYRKEGRSTKGVANAYWYGFCQGIQSVLDEQCRALMIVTPQEVTNAVLARCKGTFKGGMRGISANHSVIEEGRKDGRAVIHSRQIQG